jgi:hypothetical protein
MKTIIALIFAALLTGCMTMKPDMSQFTGLELPVGLQAPDYVPVQVAAFANLQDVQRHCSTADKQQQAAAVGGIYFGCAATTEKGCLIIVWTQTAHQIMGHEFMHCMWTPRTQAGNTQGIPAHFVVPAKAAK